MPTVQVIRRYHPPRTNLPPSVRIYPERRFLRWPSTEGGFEVYIMPPDPLLETWVRYRQFQCKTEWCWYIDYLDGTYSSSSRKTEDKCWQSVFKTLAILSGCDINYLKELMDYETLMHSIASIGS